MHVMGSDLKLNESYDDKLARGLLEEVSKHTCGCNYNTLYVINYNTSVATYPHGGTCTCTGTCGHDGEKEIFDTIDYLLLDHHLKTHSISFDTMDCNLIVQGSKWTLSHMW